MKKTILLAFAITALGACSLAGLANAPIQAKADPETSETSVETSEPVSSDAGEYAYAIRKAHVGYRDNASASYATGEEALSSYTLSVGGVEVGGWNEADLDDIVLSVDGALKAVRDN